MLMNSKRVDYILEKINFYKHDGDKTKCLGFCATVKHAKFMADEFNRILGEGSAISLSGENSVEERQEYLKLLENDDSNLKYIFSRDIFNEGIDVQDINLVLMLRPTNSSIVFTQQLGRGLRKLKGKEFLTVLDFIGNYQKSFLVTSVFSREPNPDKKTRLREVATDFNDIPGDTFIHFDEIVKEQILNQIDKEKFMSDENQKKAYFVFRKDNGNRMPYLTDFIKRGSEIDPCSFSKIKKGSLLYDSYFDFVTSAENQINSSESVILNKLSQTEDFVYFLRFLDSLLPAKRIEEWCIVNYLVHNPNEKLSVQKIQDLMKKYVDYQSAQNIKHACRFLAGEFGFKDDQKKAKLILERVKFNFDGTFLSLNENIKSLLVQQNSGEIKSWIYDYAEYAVLRYDEEFGREYYGFPFLKPYQKYSMRSIAPLCNYEKTHSAFRGSGVIYFVPTDYFIFVDLYKADLKKEEFNYEDYFISPSSFHWQGPDNWNQNQKIMNNIIHHHERGIKLHFFIRKFKEVENIPQDYIYIGDGQIFPDTVPKKLVNPVSMVFAIHEIPPLLYNDFMTKADKTKID